jgi:hypothetical protein
MTDAYRVAKNKELFSPVTIELEDGGHETRAGRFRFVDRQGMNSIKPPDWLIRDTIPENAYVMLHAPWGTYKTFVALDMALSVAVGYPMDPVHEGIEKTGKVLFAAGEGRSQVVKRVRAWEALHWHGQEIDDLVLTDPVPAITEEIEPFIEGALQRSPLGYRMVVLDTVGRSMQGTNENSQENASAFTRLVEVLTKYLDCTVLAIHHTGHKEQDRPRGSSVFGSDADVLFQLSSPAPLIASLKMQKTKDGEVWDKPRHIKLVKHVFDKDNDTLVAMRAEAADIPKTTATSNQDDSSYGKTLGNPAYDAMEKVMKRYMKKFPGKKWTSKDLADELATLDDTDMPSNTIRTKFLVAIREDSARATKQYYDAPNKVWRIPPEKEITE